MHHDHIDHTPPAAIVAPWIAPKLEIRAVVLNHLKSLAEAIREEFRGYERNDSLTIEEARLLQIRLVNGFENLSITKDELEKFIETLEDNTVLKETLRMLYGDKIQLIESMRAYKAQVDALMESNDPELARFLEIAQKKPGRTSEAPLPELEEKRARARTKAGLIIGLDYPVDDHLSRYATPHFPPSPELGEHSTLLHILEEAPSQSEIGNRGGSSLWQRLRRFLWI